MKILTLLAGFALALSAVSADALSCRRPDVARAYQKAAESQDAYIVVLGTLRYDTSRLPRGVGMGNDPSRRGARLTAKLRGTPMTAKGLGRRMKARITLDVKCAGPWCGQIPPREDILMFLRKTEGGYELEVGPCPQFFFVNPDEAQMGQAQQCLAGGPCTPMYR